VTMPSFQFMIETHNGFGTKATRLTLLARVPKEPGIV
jgi:hypothetical protein